MKNQTTNKKPTPFAGMWTASDNLFKKMEKAEECNKCTDKDACRDCCKLGHHNTYCPKPEVVNKPSTVVGKLSSKINKLSSKAEEKKCPECGGNCEYMNLIGENKYASGKAEEKETWEDRFDEKFFITETPTHKGFQVELELKMLSGIKAFIAKELSTQKEQMIQRVDLNKKSVKELLPVMGEAYRDLSVQVAYKEGYNQRVDDVLKALREDR